MRSVTFLILLVVLFPSIAYGATVSGTIYDFTLQPVQDSRLTVNTTPTQFFVAADGTYSFTVANGVYHLRAERYDGKTLVASEEKNFTVKRPGDYVVDFIVFPDLDTDQELTESIEPDISTITADDGAPNLLWMTLFLVMIIAGFGTWFVLRKETPAPANHAKTTTNIVLSTLSTLGGRATQKELRKHIPLSEAKISLMIAELENEGKIKKIKQGRGNILVLQ